MHGFGIVGCGGSAALHAMAIGTIPNARLVGVLDVDERRAVEFARQFDCRPYSEMTAFLSSEEIEFVSLCVPSGLHATVGIQVAAAKKHIIVEKPIEVSLQAADQLIEAARQADVLLSVVSQHRFDPGAAELKSLIEQGALGPLILGEARIKWFRDERYFRASNWRGSRALDGGGALINQGIHYTDLLCWCMGPVAEVMAVCETKLHDIEVEDVAVAILRFRSGATGSVIASTAIYPGLPERLEISGSEGTVVLENGSVVYRALRDSHGRAAQRAVPTLYSDGDGSGAREPLAVGHIGHARQFADVIAALEEGRRPLVTGEDARTTLEVVQAIYTSARRGCAVELPDVSRERAGTLAGESTPTPRP